MKFVFFLLVLFAFVQSDNVYLTADGTDAAGCGSQTAPCATLAGFLNGNGSLYFNNNFYFGAGTYAQTNLSVPSMAPSQTIAFFGREDNVVIEYNTTSNTYGFVVSMGATVQYTRLNYAFSYSGTSSTDRTLVRTNGGTVIANNCTFTAATNVKAAFFRNAYGGTINITRCVFQNVNWISGAYDFGCIFMGGNISGDAYATNCTFSNLTSAVSTPIIPFFIGSLGQITTVGNITIYGGVIVNVSVPSNSTIIQISTMIQYPHFTRIQYVNFANLTQNDDTGGIGLANGLVFSLSNFNAALDSQVVIENNIFDSISSVGRGGVVYSNASNLLTLSHNTFKNCQTSGVGGGAIYFDTPVGGSISFALTNCTFIGCGTVSGTGGAVYITVIASVSQYTITNCKFYNNQGSNGKDIYYQGSGWNAQSLTSSCSNCTGGNCAPSNFGTCVKEVYVTGSAGDDSSSCASAGKCGTIQYILSNTANGAYPFIGVGQVNISVSGVVLNNGREESIVGESSSSSGLIGGTSGSSISVSDVSSKLTLNTLLLIHSAGGEFLEVRGQLSASGCVVQTASSSIVLTKSFLHLYENGTAKLVGVIFSNLQFASGSNAVYTDGGVLTLAASSFNNVSSSGNGGCVSAKALSGNDVITVDDSCIFMNNVAGGNGGALYFNLTVGSPFVLLSTIFFNNTANGTGGAVYIDVSNYQEIGAFRFDRDVHFFNNHQGGNAGAESSVHINIVDQVPNRLFPCFTPLYNFSNLDYFNFDSWTVSATAGDQGRVTRNITDVLFKCVDRCTENTVDQCPTTVGCWVVNDKCVTHPCLETTGSDRPPCSGICVLENENAAVCTIDSCTQQYTTAVCNDHSAEGCGIVNGRCIKTLISVTPGTSNQIKNAVGKIPTSGRIALSGGNYTEYGITIGAKVVWIGADQTLFPSPTILEDLSASNLTEPVYSMITVNVGGGIDLNRLTLTASPGFQNGLNCSLVMITEGRLVMNYVTVANRWGTYCAIYAERPRETLITNCIFRNITHNTAKGGAGLGINMLGANAYTLVSNTTFTDVWVQGTASNTRFGGALWLEAHGIGHLAEVAGCRFERINTTDNAGALELYSDDRGGAMLCEHTQFIDCYTTKGGGGSSSRGRPVTFRNCTFTRCAAGTAGGAIYDGGRDDNYIEFCAFSNCSARRISNTYGGAAINIYTSGTTVIANCNFSQCFIEAANVASNQQYVNAIAAVVSSYLNCSITGCSFLYNYFQSGYVGRGDSGALQVGSNVGTPLLIEDCSFTGNKGVGNSVPLSAGALLVVNSTLTLKSCIFNSNEGDYAGAVLLQYVTVSYIGNIRFDSNTLVGSNANTALNLVSTNTRNSVTSGTLGNIDNICISNTNSSTPIPSTSVLVENVPVNSLQSTCYVTNDYTETTININTNTPSTIWGQFERALEKNLILNVNNDVQDFPPLPISSKKVLIKSTSGSRSLTYGNNTANGFDVSTGNLTFQTISLVLRDLGTSYSFVRLSGNGEARFDGVSVSYITTASMERKASNAGPDGISSQVIYCEVGQINISNSNFSNFIFTETGNVIYFNPSSRANAVLFISNTNFSNIQFNPSAFGPGGGDRYPRFGLAVFAALLSPSSVFYLNKVNIFNTHGAVAIIVPTLANLLLSFTPSEVTFSPAEQSHVYIGTQTDSVQNIIGNNICSSDDRPNEIANSITRGGIGAQNVKLCMGGATSCTADDMVTFAQLNESDCYNAEIVTKVCDNDAHFLRNSLGDCVLKTCTYRWGNVSVARRCGPACTLTENGVCVDEDRGCDDGSSYEVNDAGQCIPKKKPTPAWVVVVAVVVPIVVVAIVAAVVIIVVYKIRSDRIKYTSMEKKQSAMTAPASTSAGVAPSQQVRVQVYQQANQAKEEEVEEVEEEIEEEFN